MGDPFSERVAVAIAEAKAGGASAAQLDALEVIEDAGEVSFEVARTAVLATIECFHDQGLDAAYSELTRASGLVVPGYRVTAESGGHDAVGDPVEMCDTRESQWVNLLFQSQPMARQLTGEYVLSKEDELRDCLESQNVETDPDANGWELAMFALEDDEAFASGTDCFTQVGIDGL
jgi:hypothetical protein